MNKLIYLDLMEKVLSAYSDEHIKSYTESVRKNGIEEHGYPRLVANLGFLIAHGRCLEYKDEFLEMMDLCTRELPVAKTKNGIRAGNEFSVREVTMCLLEIEKTGVFKKSVTDSWRRKLSEIVPYEAYSVIASVPPTRIGNWAAFGAASEQLRKFAKIGDESGFIENQVQSQLFSFEENGMYRDGPNEPMVYDFVTRLVLSTALYYGYDGKGRERLEKELLKSADITLDMQSVTGEMPYGGRSNQFLHNDTTYAALCEFYADFFKKRRDLETAGKFKSAARLAIENVSKWLKEDKIRHIKNYYPTDSMFGCEDYAYFDKYMITTASWLCLAYSMADDDIEEITCSAENRNTVFETSDYFHKVMLRYNDYFVELDTNADLHYDASGIGRIHRKGVPSALCLSVPFAQNPNYVLDVRNMSPLAICAGINTPDGFRYAYENTTYNLIEKTIKGTMASVKFRCETGGTEFTVVCAVTDDGVTVSTEGDGAVEILFPVFAFDGETKTDISVTEKSVTVGYKGHKCIYFSNGVISDAEEIYANRNGHYKKMKVIGRKKVLLKIELQ